MPFFVYLLECSDKSFYCGYTTDLEKRVAAHNEGRGARYTRTRRPVKLVFFQKLKTRSTALKRELEIKKFSRKQKQALINKK